MTRLEELPSDHVHDLIDPDDGSPVFNDPICRICGIHEDGGWEHRLDGTCWCRPTAEDTGDGYVFVHRKIVQ